MNDDQMNNGNRDKNILNSLLFHQECLKVSFLERQFENLKNLQPGIL